MRKRGSRQKDSARLHFHSLVFLLILEDNKIFHQTRELVGAEDATKLSTSFLIKALAFRCLSLFSQQFNASLLFLLLFQGTLALVLYTLVTRQVGVPSGAQAAQKLATTTASLRGISTDLRPPFGHRTSAAAAAMSTETLRPVQKVVQGQKMMEGAGVRICRTVGTGALRNLDPFLMLDEMRLPASQATAGFPAHPHRGFETCSIMFSGKMEHQDSAGNKGVIEDGGVQWMTAGRGIIHSEMPKVTSGDLWGFQLWLNLPAKDKMVKPRYQDYQAKDIPVVDKDGARVRVMAGESSGVTGPIVLRNPGLLLDVTLAKGASFAQLINAGWNAFVYVCDGGGKVSGTKAQREQALVLGEGGHVSASSEEAGGMRFLLFGGRPIGEPIVQHGPFVMNTQEEIFKAFRDYQSGNFQNPNDDVWAAA
ncbi:g5027 [Coccomyxa elongata]